MSASVGLMDSATDASASAIGRVHDKLEPLTQRILARELVVDTLQELRRLAKGNGTSALSPHSLTALVTHDYFRSGQGFHWRARVDDARAVREERGARARATRGGG